MAKKHTKNLIVALDVGTSKVVALVGEILPDGKVDVIGVGAHASRGLKRGVVVNIDATVQSIQRAVEEAELMAGCQINAVYTGIAGGHIRSLNSHGIVAIREKEVSQVDIEQVLDAAKAVAIPADQRIIHVLAQEYIIDSQQGIRDPIGMSGVRLEAKVHMVTGAVSAAQNIIKCIRRCGLEVADICLQQLASSYAVLTDDEKDLGVCLVDIGGGTTDIAVFYNGAIRHTAVIPIAGDQVTNDIAVALRTPTQNAEEIKMQHACCYPSACDNQEPFSVPGSGDRPARTIPHHQLTEVVEARYEELFNLVKMELQRANLLDYISSGVVLTGGASKVTGAVELTEKIFGMPVRQGVPQHVSGSSEIIANPVYATAVGLLIYGQQQQQHQFRSDFITPEGVKGIWGRMKSWFQGNF